MIRALVSAISGIKQQQTKIDLIGNNIANVNSTAFKGSRANLSDTFSETLRQSSVGNSGHEFSMQIGSGVGTTSIKSNFTAGTLADTGSITDLAVSGNGWFLVRDGVSNKEFATRVGNFSKDIDGYLVNDAGHRLQGYTDSTLTTIGDIQVDDSARPAGVDPAASWGGRYSIADDGQVKITLENGEVYTRGQILLQAFSNPDALIKEGHGVYSATELAGPLGGPNSPTPEPPGTSGLGFVKSGRLELSNVNLVTEFSDLIVSQRAFQANARMVTTSDEVIQEIVNLKR